MKIDVYKQPELYEAIYGHKTDDIPFYLYWAEKSGNSVLELACGTGRLADPLISRGYQYTGLDLSSEYIDWCKNKFSEKGNFNLGDMRDFNLGHRFDLVFVGFNSFLHLLTEKDASRCLESVYSHLAEEGRFLIDIFIPDPDYLYRDEKKLYPVQTIKHPEGGDCLIREKTHFDQTSEINHIHWHFNRENKSEVDEYPFSMRMYYPDTMDRLLADAGFVIQEKWGDYDDSTFDEFSLLQLYICSK